MLTIRKESEPKELTEHRSRAGSNYDNLPTSGGKAVRKQLLREQGHLCAYCMARIVLEETKIEHWRCQDKYPGEDLNYGNMLGVCKGNEGQPEKDQTCDTRKKNHDLQYNPANGAHDAESRIRYLRNGKIESDHHDFNEQLGSALNLNHSRLMDNRKAVWDAVHEWLESKPGTRNSGEIRKLLDGWKNRDRDGKLRPYCGVAIYYLNKRLLRV